MNLTTNVIGATGLVGKQLVQQLLENENFETVKIYVRHETGILHPKLIQHIVDFGDQKAWEDILMGDVLFSALGTTLKKAGSKENQYEVDFTFNLNFARKAKQNGIENYVLVSSVGANSGSRIFYSRMKGELDEAILKTGFRNTVILRPASLTGNRDEKRTMEEISVPVLKFVTRFMFKDYRPIHAKTVAQAMIHAVINPTPDKTIWEGSEVFELANQH